MTPVPSISDIATLLTAVGIGSLIGAVVNHLLSRRGEKRQLRAKISEELSVVRELRRPVKDSVLQRQREADLVAAQVAALDHPLRDQRGAAGLVEIGGRVLAARHHVGD